MMKMKRLISIALLLCLMLCACAAPQTEPPETSVPPVTDPSTEPSTEPVTEPTEPPTEAPTTEPVPLYTNPLTGEGLDAPNLNRPVAVMFNNVKAAMPHHGTSQADILYEIMVEGGLTRCMGIFLNVEDVGALGAIRSARKYYVDIVKSYDAIYVHGGGSDEAYAYMKELGMKNIDGVIGTYGYLYFYRDQNRLDQGYSKVHTLFTNGANVIAYAQKLKEPLTRPDGVSYGFRFDKENPIAGTPANQIVVKFHHGSKPSSSSKTTTLTYDESTNQYFAYQHKQDYIDGNTNEKVAFRNVLVLRMDTSIQPENNLLLTINTFGSGTGYFACNGQMIPILWSRDGLEDPFVYTLEDGTPLTFGTGTTYIAVVPQKSTAEFQ
jgi:hypothetical protein